MKARNELICSLEDVLASLQPSTFVDEQLSHYKVSVRVRQHWRRPGEPIG